MPALRAARMSPTEALLERLSGPLPAREPLSVRRAQASDLGAALLR